MKNLLNTSKRNIFFYFLIIHTLVWSFVPLVRNVLSIDAMEAISWGELIDFGTNKHPPLSGWLASLFYNILGHTDLALYLLGQLCLFFGFIYIYKLAKHFLEEEQALCSTMVLEACFYYTWMPFIDNFNCNILLMGLWPCVLYYFYKSINENKLKNWIILGVVAGLSFLGKYQCVFLFLPMALYLICTQIGRLQFKQKGLYIAGLVAFLIISPHIIWLFNNDFFSFAYMLDRTHSETHSLPMILVKMGHLFYPIKFILGQLMAIVGCFVLYSIIVIKNKNISLNTQGKLSDKLFLIFTGLLPVIFQGIMGFVTGSRVPSIWGSTMVSLTGILLFYFFPVKFDKKTFDLFVKTVYVAMGISVTIVLTFMVFQTKLFISYPQQKIMKDFDKIWNEQTNNAPLKYVGGDIKYIFQFRLYNQAHPTIILETFGHSNPWIDSEDVLNSGALILSGDSEDMKDRVQELVVKLPKDSIINTQKYSFDVCNKIGKCQPYEFYYAIINPNKN